jgi:MFS family permease
MINVHFSESLLAYCFISSLCSVAIVLMAFTKTVAPAPHSEEVCSPKKIIQKVPLAIMGGLIGGSILGSIYTILPIFLVRVESDHNMISILMMTTILGGMLLQVPMGKLSDIIDRRKVIFLAAVGIVITSIGVFIFYKSYVMFSVVIFLLGGCAFVIYPLAISHASYFLEEHEILGAIGVITIAYGAGSVIGPIIISNFMAIVGPFGFFIIIGLAGGLLSVYTFYRISSRENATDTVLFAAVTPESVGFSEAQEVVSDKLSE